MTLVNFYIEFLKSIGFVITNEGWVMLPVLEDGSYKNAIVDNKPLCVPTDKFVELNVWDDKIPYHPMCEDIHLGQSVTIQYTVRAVKLAIMANTANLMRSLLLIAKNPKLQDEIANPKLAKILEPFGVVTDTVIKHWQAVEKKLGHNFVNLYIKSNAARTVNGEPRAHLRAALLDFPVLETLEDDSAILAGVKVGKANKELFKEALASLVPVTEVYSEFEEGPSFEVLVKIYYAIAKHQLSIYKVIEKVFPMERNIDLTWGKSIDKLPDIRFELNTLPYNLGTAKSPRIKEEAEFLGRSIEATEDTPPFEPDTPKDTKTVKDPELRRKSGDTNAWLSKVNGSRNRYDRDYDDGRDRDRDRGRSRRDYDDDDLDDYDSRRRSRRDRARSYLDDRDDDRYEHNRSRDRYDDDRMDRGRDRDRNGSDLNDWLRRKNGRR